MKHLYLEDLKKMTEAEVKEHIAAAKQSAWTPC